MADPDIDDYVVLPRRALRELGASAGLPSPVAERTIERDTRHHTALKDRILAAFGVEEARWVPQPPADPLTGANKGM